MIDEIDIWRTANVLIDKAGRQASFVAAQRADSLLMAGDLDGAELWRRIKKAVEELQDATPPDSFSS